MGVDFGAILFYGFEAEPDQESIHLDISKEISDLADEVYMTKGETVQFQAAQRGWSNEWYIVVNDSYHTAYNGEHVEVRVGNSYELWHNELIDFCHRYGYHYSTPNWHLISTID